MRCKWTYDADKSGNGRVSFECTVCESRFQMSQQSLDLRFDGDPERIFVDLADCGTIPKNAFLMLQKALDGSQDELTKNLRKLIAEGKDLPPLVLRAVKWSVAVARWKLEGSPVRTPEEVIRIHAELCVPCAYYLPNKKSCELCGCKVRASGKAFLNKIAMATESCPDKPPRWVASVIAATVRNEESDDKSV